MAAAFAVLVAAVAGGLLVYDATRAARLAHGVRAATVDVGGMTRAQAQRAIAARYGQAAARPVVVIWHGRRFTLAGAASGVHVDAAATRSRLGGWASTTARASTAPPTSARWAPPPRTGASAWPWET